MMRGRGETLQRQTSPAVVTAGSHMPSGSCFLATFLRINRWPMLSASRTAGWLSAFRYQLSPFLALLAESRSAFGKKR
jgi:hypothetical protein